MTKIIRLTERDLTRIVRRVINEDVESYKQEAMLALLSVGFPHLSLKYFNGLTSEEFVRLLRKVSSGDTFGDLIKASSRERDEFERLADKLDRFDD